MPAGTTASSKNTECTDSCSGQIRTRVRGQQGREALHKAQDRTKMQLHYMDPDEALCFCRPHQKVSFQKQKLVITSALMSHTRRGKLLLC